MGNILIHNHNLGKSQEQNKEISHIGFYYNGKHSSEMGIIRTSDGSRYNENLLPTIQDKTVPVPGGDGTYFFGSYYTQRQFNISFAFDALTETQFAELRRWLGDKQIHELIFDELPYKTYQAKVTGTAMIKHVPFGTEGESRIYKGEGSVQFTCYYPYAVCKKKWLDDYSNFNKTEWANASRLLNRNDMPPESLDNLQEVNDDPYEAVETFLTQDGSSNAQSSGLWFYNPGDVAADFEFKINFALPGTGTGEDNPLVMRNIPAGGIILKSTQGENYELYWNEIEYQGDDQYVIVNTKLNLIEGYNGRGKTGNIYNNYIKSGSFFKIPIGRGILQIDSILRHIDLPDGYHRIDTEEGKKDNLKEGYIDSNGKLWQAVTVKARQDACPLKYGYYYF